MSESIENWIKALPKRSTPTYSQRYQFQIKYCGTEEIQVKDGGEQIWADGINTQTGELLEAKFVDNPTNSPYVSGSNIPPFIRTKIVNDVENEFRRYAAVINDPNTPVESLQVIVNIQEAVPFFENLLKKYNIQGHVVVRF
ncbi:hypothetical protein F7734_33510 [Scytonema sp. UIC 10036]|uniref:restriction endonuclease fold toxin-2 domain-containing protein n=1 Tax=Scytonema sp. UIC 10036 TaxID=2304196 RepID=UPI0012DA61D4|nr:restriction endonuclease fold toxin-2 domain-containing protein [Scytonema sp. UIC 10036]MUG96991.1 hypothetical protein [Scytonema sp. UIC 10036]